jgi:DNA polymerase delta subunit 1
VGRTTQPSPKRQRQHLEQHVSSSSSSTSSSSSPSWSRPTLEPVDATTDSIAFQLVDSDYHTAFGGSGGRQAVARLFGVTMAGNSVMARVTGFLPFFYIPCWDTFDPQTDVASFVRGLEVALKDSGREKKLERYVHSAEVVERTSIWGYQFGAKGRFLKITLTLPSLCRVAAGLLDKGVSIAGVHRTFPTFESNLGFMMRFMVEHKVRGGAWVEVPKGTYHIFDPQTDIGNRLSNCQLEVELSHGDLVAHEPEGDWLKMAPLRILSFDIECAGRKGHFPTAEHDPVIQIANVLQVQGQAELLAKNVFALNTCSSIPGAKVYAFESERDLLEAWNDWFEVADCDILTGYNIVNFDIPYLLKRALTKVINSKRFGMLSRLSGEKCEIKKSSFSSKAYGNREDNSVAMPGRIQFDLLQIMRRDYKLRSYTLNAVSAHFLNTQKEDVHYSLITPLQQGDAESRKRLAIYCIKDAHLPIMLLNKLMCVINYIEMARVTGVPVNFLLSRGQQIKVISQLYRKCRDTKQIIPVRPRMSSDEKYEGATVLEPIKAFYKVPICTLDFASLYPSIMLAHNLCYSTFVTNPDRDVPRLEAQQIEYTKTPRGDYFVKESAKAGVLPEILDELLSARKNAKKLMKAAKKSGDTFKAAVLNGRQLALKISANSVYGFTGATVGQLPCLPISAGVTSFGREMIEKTKNVIETKYCMANGYASDSVVVYGDTDSVMIKFGQGVTDTVGQAINLGKEAADLVTAGFVRPIKLEFEKVYYPYLLMNKKRYAGLYWTGPDKWDMMDTKGIETVRRSTCLFAQAVITTTLNILLIDQSIPKVCAYVKKQIQSLLLNEVDLSQLVLSTSLSKTVDADDYTIKLAHSELAETMRKRDAATAPVLGDRVAYVVVQGMKKAKKFEKVEDPMYAMEHDVPTDHTFYLDKQLKQPLERILVPVIGEERFKTLFCGDHTRRIKQVSSATKVGGIRHFAKKQRTCVGCRCVIPPTMKLCGDMCDHCRENPVPLYLAQLEKVRAKEEQYTKLWTNCQRCQGSLHQDVLCSNNDCPVFYMRRQVQKDLQGASDKLEQFDLF